MNISQRFGQSFFAGGALVALLLLPATRLQADVNPPLHFGIGSDLMDLQPENIVGVGTNPVVAGGPAGGSEITLQPLAAPGFESAVYRPGFCSGPCIGSWARNNVAAATRVWFVDTAIIPNVGWHAEFELHNRAAAATPAFNIRIFDGWGNIYGGRTQLAAGQSLYIDLHIPDSNVPPPLFAEFGGLSSIWAAMTRVAGLALDLGFDGWVGEGVGPHVGPAFVVPQLVFGPLNRTNNPFFDATGFRNGSEIDPFDGPIDPEIDTISFFDPDLFTQYPELFPDLSNMVPEPGSMALLAIGAVALLSSARRRASR